MIFLDKKSQLQSRLKIYSSLSRQLENFEPLNKNQVKMYVCGPTVYDFLHIGNFRGPVFFNLVRNFLEHLGFDVKFALNFTDVDDKIINRAQLENTNPQELAEFYIKAYKDDYKSLDLKSHTYNPKVTESMDVIIQMIKDLIVSQHAYVSGGDVWYSVESFSSYGKLSGRKTQELLNGVRIENEAGKKSPLDFALWKSVKSGELSWDSPWGPGRPGWHIECSAMIKSLFGEQIDIHGGGLDLLFPHHENEVAQSEGCSHKEPLAKYWMHVNMLNFAGQKMSKSLGNLVSLRDFLKDHHPEVYKWMILSVHYRSVSEFNQDATDRAVASLAKIYSALAVADSILEQHQIPLSELKSNSSSVDSKYLTEMKLNFEKVELALCDDFSTPQVVAVIFEVIKNFNQQFKRGMKLNPMQLSRVSIFKDFVTEVGQLMSLFQQPSPIFLSELDSQLMKHKNIDQEHVKKLVADRSEYRLQKNFAKSDELRNELLKMGISVMDTPQGSFWEVTK